MGWSSPKTPITSSPIFISALAPGWKLEFFNLVKEYFVTFNLSSKNSNFHPGVSAEIKIGEDVIGVFGELHPNLINYFGIKREKLFFAELNLTKLLKYIKIKVNYESISKYPEVLRDLAITLDRDILVGDMIKEIKKKVALIEKIDIFDVYSGDKIDKDKKSVAMSIVLRDKNRTLTDEDIDKAMNTILELIKDKYNGEIRK